MAETTTTPPAPGTPRRQRGPRIDSDLASRVSYGEAIQETHDTRIKHVEDEIEQQKELVRGVVVMTTGVANQQTTMLAQMGQMRTSMTVLEAQADVMHEWIEDNRARQPARDQKDAEDSALLAGLAAAEDARVSREEEAETARVAAAKQLADQLHTAEQARLAREKRRDAYLQALGAFVGLMVVALAPSSVSQAPNVWHGPLYLVYGLFVLVAIIFAVIKPLRERV
jgi:hypothetical protein